MMRLILESDDGSQIDLHEDGCVLLDGYFPETTNQDEHVTETIEVRINGAYSVVQAKLRNINRMLVYASENTIGPFGVWLRFAINDTDDLWRSRVFGGQIDYDAKMAYYLKRSQLKIGLILGRDGFWEGPEAQIPLTNGNGTNNTAGLNVYNCNDGSGTSPNKRNNYVEIAAASVGGDLPAPVRLEMTNQYVSASNMNQVFIGLNVNSTPDLFNHMIEAESASYGGTDTTNSNYSGGKYRTFTWVPSYQELIATWLLDTTFLNRANKRFFKIIAGFTSAITEGIRLQCKIKYPGGTGLTTVLSSREIVTTTYRHQEIGELQIPPWLLSSGDLYPLDLNLYAKKTGGGSIAIDYLQITPVDGYRVLTSLGYGAADGVRLVDDGITDQLWTDGWTTPGKTGHYTPVGTHLKLKPNKTQRIYFLVDGILGDIAIVRYMSVKAFYRPRRMGL